MGYKEYKLEWDIIMPGLFYSLTVYRNDSLYIGEAFITKGQLEGLEAKDTLKRLIITMENNRSKGIEMAIVDTSSSTGKGALNV